MIKDAFDILSTTSDSVASYEFECPACGFILDKKSGGEYTPKKHKCPSCGSWLNYWYDHSKYRQDKGTVEVIINNNE